MKITKAERKALDLALYWEGEGAGIRSNGSGTYVAMLRRMEKKGLLRYAGEGPDAAGEEDGEFQIWTLDEAGYDALGIVRERPFANGDTPRPIDPSTERAHQRRGAARTAGCRRLTGITMRETAKRITTSPSSFPSMTRPRRRS
jgi:hypothetical protein